MARITGVAFCGLALACASSVQAATPMGARDAHSSTTERQLGALERKWVNAEVRHDAATLRRILDDKFIATFGSGAPMRRDAFIRAIVSGTATHVTQTLSDSIIVIDGDTGIVAGVDTVRGVVNGAPFTHAYRYTVTYVRRAGRWVALAEHMVRIPNGK